jgi:DNA polymerase-3 subunit gamma/tau
MKQENPNESSIIQAMGQALYRKYRPKTLEGTIGQEHITRTLARALSSGHISHAYLFTGPRGAGKTSIARILAHEVNSLPYTDDGSNIDIIEIDAASNRRIDEIRELRDRVNIAPTSAKYKVYIIDEVHMLTREAFNALLKTLEEPPAHVIFILATTETHKLPETIVSRTQHFAFRPIIHEKVVAHLNMIAKSEKISVDNAALQLIARHGEGSLRDSISLLDQARTMATHIEASDVHAMLGLAPDEALATLIEQVETGHSGQLIQSLQQLREQGLEAPQLAKQLGQIWRRRLLDGETALSSKQTLTILERLLRIMNSSDPFVLLEISLLEISTTVTPLPKHVSKVEVATPKTPEPVPTIETHADNPAKPEAPKKDVKKPLATNASLDAALWPQVLNAIKADHNTLYGIIRMAEPEFSDEHLILYFKFAFHQKRVNEARNKKIIVTKIHELTGKNIELSCQLRETSEPAENSPEVPEKNTVTELSEPPENSLQTISNIFGGAELLESDT